LIIADTSGLLALFNAAEPDHASVTPALGVGFSIAKFVVFGLAPDRGTVLRHRALLVLLLLLTSATRQHVSADSSR